MGFSPSDALAERDVKIVTTLGITFSTTGAKFVTPGIFD